MTRAVFYTFRQPLIQMLFERIPFPVEQLQIAGDLIMVDEQTTITEIRLAIRHRLLNNGLTAST